MFNIIPKTQEQLLQITSDNSLHHILQLSYQFCSVSDCFSFDKCKPKTVKLQRYVYDYLNTNHKDKFIQLLNDSDYFIIPGNGSRNGINAGHQFEYQLYNEFELLLKNKILTQNVSNILNFINIDNLSKVVHQGFKNNKRNISFYSHNNNYNIGSIISDVTIFDSCLTPTYLSLKYGPTVSFISAGVKKILPSDEIKLGCINNEDGKKLLDFFGIESKRFCEVFNNYNNYNFNKKITLDKIDVLQNVNIKLIENFIKNVIGYGYILVHQYNSQLHLIDMTKDKLDSLVDIKEMNIVYPTNGSAKYIGIQIILNEIEIMFKIRSTNGDLYPTHITANYKFL